MNMTSPSLLAAGLAALLLALAGGAASADAKRRPRVPPNPPYLQECGSCHLAYPAGMLPAASWRRLMAGLPQHFGTDASLEPALAASIEAWLLTHAARGARATAPPGDRITRTPWFLREHDEVPAAAWSRPPVQSPAHCAACHPKAEQGDFDEHDVRIPR